MRLGWSRGGLVLAGALGVALAGCSDRQVAADSDGGGTTGTGDPPPGEADGGDDYGWTEYPPEIVFESDRDREMGQGIFAVGAGGGDVRLLSSSEIYGDSAPHFTADGMRMVYASHRYHYDKGSVELFVRDFAAGTDENITMLESIDSDPQWSPDGTRMVFSAGDSGDWLVHLLTPGDEPAWEPTQLTAHGGDRYPKWSPDGEHVVFERNDGADWRILVLRPAEGSDATDLSEESTRNGHPDWSPGGERIVFYSQRIEGGAVRLGRIYSIHRDGTDRRQLTSSTGSDHSPGWSPDGERIAFVREVSLDESEIWVMGADGSDAHPLADAPPRNLMPAWSPDNDVIAFVSTRDGNAEVYSMATDGSNQLRLTDHPGVDTNPLWRPRRTELDGG